ncbi:hypothetical protein [Marisediminicola sp. LYQ134]|uniref:hypothetical protein n=1 Tax=Marisediminicola sp. LYQ134 TaxID=3391061 RepID=UPI00398358F6
MGTQPIHQENRSLERVVRTRTLNRNAAIAERVGYTGAGFFALLFALVWVPYYLFKFPTQDLFPLWLPIVLVVWAIALTAVVFGAIGLRRASGLANAGRGSAIRGIFSGGVLLVLALPVLWFGGAPVDLSGRNSEQPAMLGPDESSTGPCLSYEPVDVLSLNTPTPLGCEPQGTDLVFPDGTRLTLPSSDLGAGSLRTNGNTGNKYEYVSVGIYGLYASQSSSDCSEVQEWGSPEARERVHEVLGRNYACEGN